MLGFQWDLKQPPVSIISIPIPYLRISAHSRTVLRSSKVEISHAVTISVYKTKEEPVLQLSYKVIQLSNRRKDGGCLFAGRIKHLYFIISMTSAASCLVASSRSSSLDRACCFGKQKKLVHLLQHAGRNCQNSHLCQSYQ